MCTLYLSATRNHIHVSDIVGVPRSIHVAKIKNKTLCGDYVNLAKHGGPRIMSPYTKNATLPLSAQAQYSNYLKNASVLRQ